MTVPVTVVILTLNEELDLPHAVASVRGWARSVLVVDSCSKDSTVSTARQLGCEVLVQRFENYGAQRNLALDYLAQHSPEWVLFLDADERLTPELKSEIAETLSAEPGVNGFYLKRRFIWMGRWIRRGYYPTWLLRLFRYGKGRCEQRSFNEHMIVEGKVGYLRHDFLHEDHKGLDHWLAKHQRYARMEAQELFAGSGGLARLPARLLGTQAERKRWLRYRIWNHLPPFVRPVLYFIYRYVLRGGFLDGSAGFSFHVLQALWFPLLIDIELSEMRRQKSAPSRPESKVALDD